MARKVRTARPEDTYEGLASWLQEVGRRRLGRAPAAGVEPSKPDSAKPAPRHRRQVVLFSVLALAFLQYYAMDVMVQIYSLPSLVVFVPTATGPRA
jgi:hypothetical protein